MKNSGFLKFAFYFCFKLADKTDSMKNVKVTFTTWTKLILIFFSVYTKKIIIK